MNRRYKFLAKDEVYDTLNKLRAAFLAAKNGEDVEEIIMGLLTNDERLKVGRRIKIANMINLGYQYRKIREELKVGFNTIESVHRSLNKYPRAYELVEDREDKVEKQYQKKAYIKTGGAKMIKRGRKYTGFKRSKVKR